MTTQLTVFNKKAEAIKNIKAISINNAEELFKWTEKLGNLKQLLKDSETERKSLSDPHSKKAKAIIAEYKPHQTEMQRMINIINSGFLAYNQRQRALLLEEAKKSPEKILEAPTRTVKTDNATVSFKKTWKFEIEDLLEVPKEYWSVDEDKIKRAVALGTYSIKGVRIYQEESIATRTKN